MNPAAPIANAILITGAGGRVGLHLAERMLDQQQQVGRHQEAARLQYGLVDRALQLGWAASASSSSMRISAAQAGGLGARYRDVPARPLVSQLAQLLEICALSGTLIAGTDGVCDQSC
jgi:NAD(P)-dependent dehydrogenase (short-subunit alcohol dehydrogenase family)